MSEELLRTLVEQNARMLTVLEAIEGRLGVLDSIDSSLQAIERELDWTNSAEFAGQLVNSLDSAKEHSFANQVVNILDWTREYSFAKMIISAIDGVTASVDRSTG